MNLLREYIRGLLIEQEEEEPELSELDKIKEIFAVNGAQAVELGEMLLPDAKEIGMMKRAVRVVREFLELFEKPAYEANLPTDLHFSSFWYGHSGMIRELRFGRPTCCQLIPRPHGTRDRNRTCTPEGTRS
tara:strand:- start:1687 stop:2079 length:393 start_codon:yes stop_codon:yes gene_type:complete